MAAVTGMPPLPLFYAGGTAVVQFYGSDGVTFEHVFVSVEKVEVTHETQTFVVFSAIEVWYYGTLQRFVRVKSDTAGYVFVHEDPALSQYRLWPSKTFKILGVEKPNVKGTI